jgi:hypothetical protein
MLLLKSKAPMHTWEEEPHTMRKSFARFLGLGLLGVMLATTIAPTTFASPQKKGKKKGGKGSKGSQKKGGRGGK